MLRLIPFELRKIWPKPGFSLAVCALLLLHLFLLWYTSLPGEGEPALSSYRAAVRELSGMDEEEKGEYLEKWKETVDGVSFVRNILSMQDFGNEMEDTLAEQELAENPGVFEKYYEPYRSGGYLRFTDSLERESALAVSLWLLFILAAGGVLASLKLYAHMQSFAARRPAWPFILSFRPHVCVLRHEAYKILVTNRGLLLFIVFAGLLGFKSFDHAYVPSAGERYYRDLMSRLEGGLTPEKEEIFLDEQERYEAAFDRLEQIGRLENEGRLSRIAADELKSREYMALSFYPAFQRVEAQYENCKERGGGFVYDTGYLYLFGAEGGDFAVDLLILVIGIILTASGAISMEYRTGSLYLLCATRTGRRRIFLRKILLCVGLTAALALVPLVCRFVCIASVYPMGSPRAAARNLPCFSGSVLPLPVWAMVLVLVLSQTAAAALAALATLALSLWRKNQVQTVFFALLLLAVPLVACLLGFDAAKWFSLYPLYGWTGML